MAVIHGAQLAKLLESTTGERKIVRWLTEHPHVLTQCAGRPFGSYYLISEFKFGSDFRADFVALNPFSGGWDIHYFELEPASAKLFTKKGHFAKRLNEAVTQIDLWRRFLENNRDTVLKELSKAVMKKELLSGALGHEPADNCGWPLYHPRSLLNHEFKIVIGRRASLSDVQIEQKASFLKNHNIEVMTYDRLIESANVIP